MGLLLSLREMWKIKKRGWMEEDQDEELRVKGKRRMNRMQRRKSEEAK